MAYGAHLHSQCSHCDLERVKALIDEKSIEWTFGEVECYSLQPANTSGSTNTFVRFGR